MDAKALKEQSEIFPTVEPSLPLWKILQVMKNSGKNYLPVVVDDKITGVISERELRIAMDLSGGTIDATDIMNTNLLCAEMSWPISQVVREVSLRDHDSVVIVDEFGKVCRILSVNEILKNLFRFVDHDQLGTLKTIL